MSDRNETTHIYVHTSYGTKAMSRGFSAGAKQVMKSADYKKSLSSLLIHNSRQLKKKHLIWLSMYLAPSTNWGHYFYVSGWRRDRHFKWSFEPREGLAAYRAKGSTFISQLF